MTIYSIRDLRASLPVNSLVLHDVYGFGNTVGIIQNSTGSVEYASVAVSFDDDDYRINDCRVGEGKDEETGETYKYGYRQIRLSYLELDQDENIEGYCAQAVETCELRAEPQLDEEEDDAAYTTFLKEEFDG
jgi:hypothetical protein